MIITENAKKVIEQLIPEYGDELLMYGADMYRKGMVTGAVSLAIGIGCGCMIEKLKDIYKYQKSKKNKDEP